jgi:hypothetical protein
MQPMSRSEIDRLLPELRAGRERLAVALVTMDTQDSGLAHLRTARLSGATLECWQRIAPRIDALWAGFSVLGAGLDNAAALRSKGPRPARAQLTELADLLSDPIEDETLPDEYRAATLVELCQRLEADCQRVRGDLADIGARLATAIERSERLERVLATAREAAGGTSPEWERHAAEVRAANSSAAGDPLGVDLDSPRVRAVSAALEALTARLTARAALRNGYPGRRAALEDALGALDNAERAARDAYARAAGKILAPGFPPATDSEPVLRRRLVTFDRLDLAALDEALPALERAVTAALDSAADRQKFAEGLLARRDELRGRLEAYRMKAVRTGRAERENVLAHFATAHALLWVAPCDLPAATRAVVAYQRSLLDGPLPLLDNPGGDAA